MSTPTVSMLDRESAFRDHRAMRVPNVCSISPACPFLRTFVRALAAGEVIPGLSDRSGDPLWIADARIYVPTQRSARALHAVFGEEARGASVVLPRILPLGALDATEPELLFAEPEPDGGGQPLPPAASTIWRRLQLATLIKGWSDAVGGALRTVDSSGHLVVDESEAFRVATSTADAFALAGDLARLIDELRIEGVEWRALDGLRMASFDDYWRITTTFLSIAVTQWPRVLAAHGLVDRSERQIALIDAQAGLMADAGERAPVLAIGSTGSNRATARLLGAIARAPMGAVVLPGLDDALDEQAWTMLRGQQGTGEEPSFGHPQATLARLLNTMGIERAAVRRLGVPAPAMLQRDRFVAEALRPADTTDHWRDWRKGSGRDALEAALAGVAFAEASDEREEALCLAIAMREALETPGRTAALVTPDRELARRVRGELLRWNVEVTDTGGEPFANRPLGVLARLVAAASTSLSNGAAARDLGALLAHPLATFGRDRGIVERLAATLAVGVLRAVPVDGRGSDAIFAAARDAAADRHAHPAQKAIDAADWGALEALWEDLHAALAPLASLSGTHPLGRWVVAHRDAIAAVAAATAMAPDEADALDSLFDELASDAGEGLRLDSWGYGILFGRVAGEAALRNTDHPHPRLQIYGLIEARLMTADLMMLGGLDETIWPPQAQSDPFLNRPMRADLGLAPPERRIGQTAHDFVQALGNRDVLLSRARKRGGAPCVPSRLLLRLAALGDKEWAACRSRGDRLLGLARVIDGSPTTAVPAPRPKPTPPLALRPTRLSVTQVETLRRDPYAIFAAQILDLAPLPRIGVGIEASEFGSLMHDALREFTVGDAASGSAAARQDSLDTIVRRIFAATLADPVFRALRWPALEKTMRLFLAFDAGQRATARDIAVERDGRISMLLADGTPFLLHARADRIDRHADGSATLVDYKTGQPPGLKEVKVGFAPQLTLEAAMLRRGGFGPPHEGGIAATYVKLGGKNGGFTRTLGFEGETLMDVAETHFAGLERLLSSFRLPATGYPSRPFPKYAKRVSDFDHLARVREWSLAGGEEEGA